MASSEPKKKKQFPNWASNLKIFFRKIKKVSNLQKKNNAQTNLTTWYLTRYLAEYLYKGIQLYM